MSESNDDKDSSFVFDTSTAAELYLSMYADIVSELAEATPKKKKLKIKEFVSELDTLDNEYIDAEDDNDEINQSNLTDDFSHIFSYFNEDVSQVIDSSSDHDDSSAKDEDNDNEYKNFQCEIKSAIYKSHSVLDILEENESKSFKTDDDFPNQLNEACRQSVFENNFKLLEYSYETLPDELNDNVPDQLTDNVSDQLNKTWRASVFKENLDLLDNSYETLPDELTDNVTDQLNKTWRESVFKHNLDLLENSYEKLPDELTDNVSDQLTDNVTDQLNKTWRESVFKDNLDLLENSHETLPDELAENLPDQLNKTFDESVSENSVDALEKSFEIFSDELAGNVQDKVLKYNKLIEETNEKLESEKKFFIKKCEKITKKDNSTVHHPEEQNNLIVRNSYEFDEIDENMIDINDSDLLMKYVNKLFDIQSYGQIINRLNRLVNAITKLDKKRLNGMNAKMLKNFLHFVKIYSLECHSMSSAIRRDIFLDLEKKLLTRDELLYCLAVVSNEPPENELQKCHDNNTALSEHQLRVQASLQRLNIPEWYRQYSSTLKPTDTNQGGYVPGSFTKKRNSDAGRWTGLNSKTTSLSSLGSHRTDRSPLLLSPSAHSHHGQTGFSRWSTSHLNSSQTSPSASTRGSFSRGGVLQSSTLSGQSGYSARSSIRQPYMGWRSQEKLSQPRTPAERLASSLLARQQSKQQKQQNDQQEPAVTPEIQSSIKEVTSAIVHFVNDQTDRTSRSRSTSPTARKCWLESSFVGNRPLDSPQTPVIDTFSPRGSADTTTISRLNGVATPIPVLSVHSSDRPSPSSTTLEDVLASLLGLPTDSYRSSDTTLANDTNDPNNHLQIETIPPRRRSEGDAQKQRVDSTSSLRRGSLDSTEFKNETELVKCRFPKCDSSTTIAEAKKYYKSCHNCSHMYCSRECRRSHWEKHRKACLHSRVSALCRQVLSACKDDADTLRHLSLLARKGYVSQGRGVIRILFRSPESAEAFVKQGFQCIGEASYLRWPDLMPAEMGAELYSELLRLSTEYKTDSKMLIYVAICVVSETPGGSGSAPVKWERQLVSRCAKLKLSKTISSEITLPNVQNEQNNDILILTFCTAKKNNQKVRELIMINIQNILKRRGVSVRRHFPEIHQRLNSFVEGTTDKFLPVTIHPRDNITGRAFICIIMANTGETDKLKLPTNGTNNVQIIDNLESVEWN